MITEKKNRTEATLQPNIQRATKEIWFLIGFLVILVVSLLTAVVVITTGKNKESSTNSDVPKDLTNTCISEECIRSAALISNSMDTSVNPCDDFYQYSCGNWQKDHPSPNNFAGWSHFDRLNINMKNSLLDLLNKPNKRDYLKPLFSFYGGCVDTVSRDKAGYIAFKNLIKQIGGWPLIEDNWDQSKYDWVKALTTLSGKIGSNILLGIDVQPNYFNNSQTLIEIGHQYIKPKQIIGIYRHPDQKPIGGSYYEDKDLLLQIAQLVKGSVISTQKWNTMSKQVSDFESQLLKIVSPQETQTISNYMKSIIPVKQLDQYKGFNWPNYFNTIFSNVNITIKDNDYVVIMDHLYFSNLFTLINSQSKSTIANYIASKLAVFLSTTTTSAMKLLAPEEFQNLKSSCLSSPRVVSAMQVLPNLIGRLYIDNQFDRQLIGQMRSLIDDLKQAFNELIDEDNWIDEDTKSQAKSKLDAITVNIASPEFTLNDSQLLEFANDYKNIDASDFSKSVLTIAEIDFKKKLKYFKTSFPKGHWPQTKSAADVNAYYYPPKNGIYFPAAIAQFPFYQHNGLFATNIGAIGMVIGHELTHAFDNSGSNYDKNGNLKNWWTDKTRKTFDTKAQCFVDQYNKFSFNEVEKHVDGKKTLGENIADNGGIREAFRAFEIMKKRNELNNLPGKMSNFTHEQIFFLSFANIWCSSKMPSAISYQINNDEHSPEKARVLGALSNFDEFSKAFNCKIGSKMNMNSDKCLLW